MATKLFQEKDGVSLHNYLDMEYIAIKCKWTQRDEHCCRMEQETNQTHALLLLSLQGKKSLELLVCILKAHCCQLSKGLQIRLWVWLAPLGVEENKGSHLNSFLNDRLSDFCWLAEEYLSETSKTVQCRRKRNEHVAFSPCRLVFLMVDNHVHLFYSTSVSCYSTFP